MILGDYGAEVSPLLNAGDGTTSPLPAESVAGSQLGLPGTHLERRTWLIPPGGEGQDGRLLLQDTGLSG